MSPGLAEASEQGLPDCAKKVFCLGGGELAEDWSPGISESIYKCLIVFCFFLVIVLWCNAFINVQAVTHLRHVLNCTPSSTTRYALKHISGYSGGEKRWRGVCARFCDSLVNLLFFYVEGVKGCERTCAYQVEVAKSQLRLCDKKITIAAGRNQWIWTDKMT